MTADGDDDDDDDHSMNRMVLMQLLLHSGLYIGRIEEVESVVWVFVGGETLQREKITHLFHRKTSCDLT